MTDPTPPAVSPVDTALREQVATTLEERIGDNSDLYETVDDVLAVVSPLLSASAHREGQAVARQAVLRADLRKAQRQARAWKLMASARAESRDHYAAELKLAVEGLEEYQRELAELRAVVASRPAIPDDAAERRALMARFDALLAERDFLDEDDQLTVLHVFESLLADLGATPTTGPAPAAADGGDR